MGNGRFVVAAPAEEVQLSDFVGLEDCFELVGITEEAVTFNPAGGPGLMSGKLCIGLATWDETKADRLVRVRKHLANLGQPFLPEVFILDGEINHEALTVVANDGLGRLARAQANLILQMSRDLGVLRRQHEDMQNHFAAVEDYIAQAHIQKFEEAFTNEPDDDVVLDPPPPSDAPIRLQQLLPVSSVNICAVALHVAAPSVDKASVVAVRLVTPEDGRTIAAWQIQGSQLRPGWNRFGLPRTPGGLARSLRLELEATALPVFSLGPLLPLPAYQALDGDSGDSVAERALALRVMVTLPGVRVVHDRRTFLTAEPTAFEQMLQTDPAETSLPGEALHRLLMMNVDGSEARPDGIVQRQGDTTILCRPVTGNTTIALLPDACPSGTDRISCTVFLDSPISPEVEFRIGWLAKGQSLSSKLARADSAFVTDDCACSDWLRVGPQQEMRIETRARPGVVEGGSIVLATRMAERSARSDHALAKFRRFKLRSVDP